eukprot:5735686-Prymnesium_polylepis.1
MSMTSALRAATASVLSEQLGTTVTADEVVEMADKAAGPTLGPGYDRNLRRHSFAASFSQTERKLGVEPGFEVTGQTTDVHTYVDPQKTSFLGETRGGAWARA